MPKKPNLYLNTVVRLPVLLFVGQIVCWSQCTSISFLISPFIFIFIFLSFWRRYKRSFPSYRIPLNNYIGAPVVWEPCYVSGPTEFLFRYFAITSFTPLISQLTSLRMFSCNDISIIISYLPNPSARVGYDTRSIFKRSLTGLNSDFSFS